MELFGKTLTIEQTIGLVKNIASDKLYRECNENKCLVTDAALELAAELESRQKPKYLLLTANNVDTDIQATPFITKEEAYNTMYTEAANCCNDDECNIPSEMNITKEAASVYNDGDLYYWKIVQLQ